jgi:signal transduction histidine kinase
MAQAAALAAEVAERQRTEESLRLLNEQLENRVQERTAELEKRNEELDAFAHTVAHDLKSPLTQVKGYAELLMEMDDALSAEEHRQALESIARSSARMNNIIDELLLFASVHKAEVPRTPLDMASVVSAAQERVAYLTEELGAELILPTVWPTALGYGPWVEEVWVNYLSNALKYGGRPPHLELGAEVVPEAETKDCDGETLRKQVRFWVRDNGPGLTPEEQKELFAPFARLAQARTSGYGLGLSIVRRIVEKLGGQVSVMSTPGEGSLFSFTLPAV